MVDTKCDIALPPHCFVDCLGRLVVSSVDRVSRSARMLRAYSVPLRSSAEATPFRRASGTTNKSLRITVRAIAPEEKLGYSWMNPTAAAPLSAKNMIDWLCSKRCRRKFLARSGSLGWAVKLAIRVEQRNDQVQVLDCCLPDLKVGISHTFMISGAQNESCERRESNMDLRTLEAR